jgi:hypothetical protein
MIVSQDKSRSTTCASPLDSIPVLVKLRRIVKIDLLRLNELHINMKTIKTVAIIVAVLFLGFTIWNASLPGEFYVERSESMAVEPSKVSETVSDFSTWPFWSAWFQMDTTMSYELGQTYKGVGGSYSWISESMGGGNMNILEYTSGVSMRTEINFDGQGPSNGSWKFVDQGNGSTLVTWGLHGEMSFFNRWIGSLMETWVGPDFETGLANLKAYVEALPVEPTPSEEVWE